MLNDPKLKINIIRLLVSALFTTWLLKVIISSQLLEAIKKSRYTFIYKLIQLYCSSFVVSSRWMGHVLPNEINNENDF